MQPHDPQPQQKARICKLDPSSVAVCSIGKFGLLAITTPFRESTVGKIWYCPLPTPLGPPLKSGELASTSPITCFLLLFHTNPNSIRLQKKSRICSTGSDKWNVILFEPHSLKMASSQNSTNFYSKWKYWFNILLICQFFWQNSIQNFIHFPVFWPNSILNVIHFSVFWQNSIQQIVHLSIF